jgi:hypothetical protein
MPNRSFFENGIAFKRHFLITARFPETAVVQGAPLKLVTQWIEQNRPPEKGLLVLHAEGFLSQA